MKNGPLLPLLHHTGRQQPGSLARALADLPQIQWMENRLHRPKVPRVRQYQKGWALPNLLWPAEMPQNKQPHEAAPRKSLSGPLFPLVINGSLSLSLSFS